MGIPGRLAVSLGLAACLSAGACQPAVRVSAVGAGAASVPASRPARLSPPPALEISDGPSAVYRTAVALQLQPGWAQFLEDCRLRLPPAHPLNTMSLAAVVELVVAPDGQLASADVQSSGNPDFDRAVGQVLGDAVPLPRPPRVLWSDDDRVYLRWLFARDRRQAGPATATIAQRPLPVREVARRLIGERELSRAAERIAREPDGFERSAATGELMFEALREALGSSDGVVRRAALDAIARIARAGRGGAQLAASVRDVLGATGDLELRAAALAAVVALGDRLAIGLIVDQLELDLADGIALARSEAAALVELGGGVDAARVLRAALEGAAQPNLLAVDALGAVHDPELAPQVAAWVRASDARLRAAACGRASWPDLGRGLRDRDATVRSRCLDAVIARPVAAWGALPGLGSRLAALARDRDAAVRARAVQALARVGERVPDRHDDRAPAVRAAYATALAAAPTARAARQLEALLEDRAPEVRGHALASLLTVVSDPEARDRVARAALRDPAAEVRRVAVGHLDEPELARLSSADDDAGVRSEALVELVRRRGRTASADLVLARLAAAPPGTVERVRSALAWLLAR